MIKFVDKKYHSYIKYIECWNDHGNFNLKLGTSFGALRVIGSPCFDNELDFKAIRTIKDNISYALGEKLKQNYEMV